MNKILRRVLRYWGYLNYTQVNSSFSLFNFYMPPHKLFCLTWFVSAFLFNMVCIWSHTKIINMHLSVPHTILTRKVYFFMLLGHILHVHTSCKVFWFYIFLHNMCNYIWANNYLYVVTKISCECS